MSATATAAIPAQIEHVLVRSTIPLPHANALDRVSLLDAERKVGNCGNNRSAVR
jgi:hypothetical protein